jgi:cytochrome c oxidase subunit II
MFDPIRRVVRRAPFAATILAGAFVLGACVEQDADQHQTVLDPQGEDARKILDLTIPFFWIAVVIGIGVVGATVVLALRFREKPGEERNPVQTHGHTALEITWTIIPALILAVMGVFTVASIFDLTEKPAGADVINIDVVGRQWFWEYDYTDDGFVTANELHIPVDTPVYLSITATDVIHSFWVPALAGKKDAVPGRTSYLTISGEKAGGVYHGQCAEYCGLSHARMGLKVFVDSREDYDRWVADQKAKASPELARAVDIEAEAPGPIVTFGCQTCHGFEPDSDVRRGPNLTHVGDRTTFAAVTYDMTLENLTEWIHNAPSKKPMEIGPDPKNPLVGMPDFSEQGMTLDQARDIAQTLLCDTASYRDPEDCS